MEGRRVQMTRRSLENCHNPRHGQLPFRPPIEEAISASDPTQEEEEGEEEEVSAIGAPDSLKQMASHEEMENVSTVEEVATGPRNAGTQLKSIKNQVLLSLKTKEPQQTERLPHTHSQPVPTTNSISTRVRPRICHHNGNSSTISRTFNLKHNGSTA